MVKILVFGGPHDGAITKVPELIGEGQLFLLNGAEYFYHLTKGGIPILAYYKSSLDL